MNTIFILNETRITGDTSFDKRTQYFYTQTGSSAVTYELVTSASWTPVSPTASLQTGTTKFLCLTNSTVADASGSTYKIDLSFDAAAASFTLDSGMSVQLPIYSNDTIVYTNLNPNGITGSCNIDVVRIQK